MQSFRRRALAGTPSLAAVTRRLVVTCALLVAIVVLLAVAAAQPQEPAVLYRVVIEVGENAELTAFLLEVSEAHQLESRPPPSIISLRRRASADEAALKRALRSRGYYDSDIEFTIDSSESPVILAFKVNPGARYQLREVKFDLTPHGTAFTPPAPATIGVAPGSPADAGDILAAEQRLLDSAKQAAYGLAELGERSAVVDHASQTMDLTLALETGPPTALGPVRFVGVESVDSEFLASQVPWRPGQAFDPDLVAKLREHLVDTNLFSSTRIEAAAELDEQGQLPVTVYLGERKHRSIRATVGYNIDQGPAVRGNWTHRNFFGAGERMLVEGTWSGIGPRVLANLRKPNFFRHDQALILESSFANLDTDAYRSKSGSTSLAVERTLAPGMTFLVGPAFRFSDVQEADVSGTDNFSLLFFPAKFDWDNSNSLLDPTRGNRMLFQIAPYIDLKSELTFGKMLTRYSHYFTLKEEPRLVLAGRLAVGGISGAARDDIPADERFYAGGGGSVRGYGFQLASPLNDEGDPIGGNSLLELAAEVRWQAFGDFGLVGFVDAGSAFEDNIPQDLDGIRFGVGVGLRYATPIGPLRFDVGVPIDRREDIDDPYQIYISIGQAF